MGAYALFDGINSYISEERPNHTTYNLLERLAKRRIRTTTSDLITRAKEERTNQE